MALRKPLRVAFVDLWSDTHAAIELTLGLLGERYSVILDENRPDLVFFSVFGNDHRKYNCRKVYYSGENFRVPLNSCDFAFSMKYLDHPRHMRLPHFVLYDHFCKLAPVDKSAIRASIPGRTRFCTFVVSNPSCRHRIKFFHLLNEAKRVDSGGKHLNNIGGPVADKLEFLKEGRFHIAFENESCVGYVTEKLTGALAVGTVPIYWGCPRVSEDIDPGCFVNAHDYENLNHLVDAVLKLEADPVAYERMAVNPRFAGDRVPVQWTRDGILRKLVDIIEGPVVPHSVVLETIDRALGKLDRFIYHAKRRLNT